MSNFKWHKFDELYKMSSGISSKPSQAGHGSPFVSFSTVFNNYFLPDNLDSLMDTSKEEQELYSVKEGDILLTRTSEVIDELGMSCVALKDYPKATFSGFVKRLRPLQHDVTYHKYLGFYLRSTLFRKTMTNNAIMTLRASLNEEIFSYLNLYLPDYGTQKTTGDFLFLLNTKIESNKCINSELESMAKVLYDYWFVQFDFPGADGKPYKSSGGKMIWNQDLKREIPEGWKVGTTSDLFEFNPTLSIKNSSIASYIDMDALPTIGFMTKEVQKKQFSGGVKFQNGDLVIARITPCLENGKTGLITLLDENEIGFGSTEFIVLRGKNRSLSGFASFLARSELFRKFAIANMLGTSGRKRVDAKALEKFKLAIPENSILDKFEEITNSFFDITTINTKQNQQITQLRDWILPLLMNGQVTIANKALPS